MHYKKILAIIFFIAASQALQIQPASAFDWGGCCGGSSSGGGTNYGGFDNGSQGHNNGGGDITTHTPVVVTPVTPSCSIAASAASITSGSASTLSWNTDSAVYANFGSATFVGRDIVALTGSRSVTPTTTTTYTMTVTSATGHTATCSATVVVTQPIPAPSCSLTASPDNIAYGGSSTLSWTTLNATSASLTTIGSVALNGSYSVVPTSTTTYVMTVTGQGGTATCTKTVTVAPVTYTAPTCSIDASQPSIQQGQATSIFWNTTNATTASLSTTGTVALNGSQTIYPSTTTTYTLTVSGNGGSSTCSKTIGVTSVYVPPATDAPYCSISASQTSVSSNGSVTLYWNTTNAYMAYIDSIGSVQTSGSYTVNNIVGSRTFTMTATGQGGVRTCSVTVVAQATPSYYTNYIPPAPTYYAPTPAPITYAPAAPVHYGAPFGSNPVRYVSNTRVSLASVPYTGAEDYVIPFFVAAFFLSVAYMGSKVGTRFA
jgi:hypothetical protein